jgi:hypothetical protein
MQTKIRSVLTVAILAASALLIAPCSHAQSAATNAPAAQPPAFYTTVENYLTVINTNFTFTNATIETATGYEQQTGANAASDLTVQYDIGRWNVGAAGEFSGVGSPFSEFKIQGGYALIEHYDIKVDADLRAGWDWNVRGGVIEPAIFFSKKMTANTFLRPGISFPIYTKGAFNRNPTFYVETGFTF